MASTHCPFPPSFVIRVPQAYLQRTPVDRTSFRQLSQRRTFVRQSLSSGGRGSRWGCVSFLGFLRFPAVLRLSWNGQVQTR